MADTDVPMVNNETGLIAPSPSGRNNLVDDVRVYAHHSALHDGINIEIDAPAGVHVTVHLNDGLIAEETVEE
ncbi:hypothetical protein [Mycobacteroides abscessus]|uniref:hypothetical protein n=1 Tax=Mycobacteroides abscessus TaxID=36809 RepID=UPI0012FFF809|nr:hypothetical protein [Mycobacteroides abscessus]